MSYLYVIKSGRYDYAHIMFITSDISKASNFIDSYNKLFSETKWDDYVEHMAYLEIIPDYVPELEKIYYMHNSIVYSILANKNKLININEIRGYPISNYIDFNGNSNEIFGNDNKHIILDELLKNKYSVFETRNGYCVLIVVIDKGMSPCQDTVFNDWIPEDLKQNLIYKAKELLNNIN